MGASILSRLLAYIRKDRHEKVVTGYPKVSSKVIGRPAMTGEYMDGTWPMIFCHFSVTEMVFSAIEAAESPGSGAI